MFCTNIRSTVCTRAVKGALISESVSLRLQSKKKECQITASLWVDSDQSCDLAPFF